MLSRTLIETADGRGHRGAIDLDAARVCLPDDIPEDLLDLLGGGYAVPAAAQVVGPLEQDDVLDPAGAEKVALEAGLRRGAVAPAQDAVAAQTEVQHRETPRPAVLQQRAGQLVGPAVLAVGRRAAPVGNRVAEHGDGRTAAPGLHVDGADGVPVVGRGHRRGEVRRIACSYVGSGPGAGVAGQARGGYLAVMDRDGEVHPLGELEADRVGDGFRAGRHREGARSAESQLNGGSGDDLRARAHRLGAGDLHAQDFGLVLVEQVRKVQTQGLAPDRHLDDLTETVVREAGCGRIVVRLGDLQGRGPGGDPVAGLCGGAADKRGCQRYGEEYLFHRLSESPVKPGMTCHLNYCGRRGHLGLRMTGRFCSSWTGIPSRSDWI